jgi:hypothetical protein
MVTTDTLDQLQQLRQQFALQVQARQWDAADALAEQILAITERLRPQELLTTSEAAKLLGFRSRNTLKALVRAECVPTVRRGNRTMIPLEEVVRLRDQERTRGLHASERLHEQVADLGIESPLTPEELADLEAARPGVAPWKRA